MSSRPCIAPFRVFGSPYTISLHQHVTYLRVKQLPFKVYCTNFTTTFLYSLYYRARGVFCTVTPNATSCLQVWQLVENTELDEDAETIAQSARGEVTYVDKGHNNRSVIAAAFSSPASVVRTQKLLVARESHPQLHLACWCVVLYSCWWLPKTGAMFRYVQGQSLDVLEGYVRYFFLLPGVGFARALAPRFREIMKRVVAATGVSELTAPFMEEHFQSFCCALEAHLGAHPEETFLLGTPHPTLADVTLGAAFSCLFFMDDPPSVMMTERYPCLTEYVERVTGWRGTTFADGEAGLGDEHVKTSPTDGQDGLGGHRYGASSAHGSSRDYADTVPESLAPCFRLIAEVFPFLMSQCASFNAFMAGDGVLTLKKEPLEGEWKGCEGYLLPQLTSIRSLMIVDDHISSVQARSQDLELAFLASREVHDEGLYDFGRRDRGVASASRKEGQTRTWDGSLSDPSILPPVSESTSGVPIDATEADLPDSFATHPVSESVVRASSTGGVDENAKDAGKEPHVAAEVVDLRRPLSLSVMRAEEADYYRAYTTASSQSVAGNASSLSGVLSSTHRAVAAAKGGGEAMIVRDSVKEHLDTLRAMLAKMRCPQYTLTSVFQGRRIFVAAIPEYEVAKVRKVRQRVCGKGH